MDQPSILEERSNTGSRRKIGPKAKRPKGSSKENEAMQGWKL
jgi:hypothetical protein